MFLTYYSVRQEKGPDKYMVVAFIACCEDFCKCPNIGEGEMCFPVQQKRNSTQFKCECRYSSKALAPMSLRDKDLPKAKKDPLGEAVPPPAPLRGPKKGHPNPDVRNEEF